MLSMLSWAFGYLLVLGTAFLCLTFWSLGEKEKRTVYIKRG